MDDSRQVLRLWQMGPGILRVLRRFDVLSLQQSQHNSGR